MRTQRDDEDNAADGAEFLRESSPPPYLALARLLRYARREALSQHREKAAHLIEAAIASLRDTSVLPKH